MIAIFLVDHVFVQKCFLYQAWNHFNPRRLKLYYPYHIDQVIQHIPQLLNQTLTIQHLSSFFLPTTSPCHPPTFDETSCTAMLARNVPGDGGDHQFQFRPVPRAQSEFKNIITDLLKIPSGLDLPQERVMSMWRNADKAVGLGFVGRKFWGVRAIGGGEDWLIPENRPWTKWRLDVQNIIISTQTPRSVTFSYQSQSFCRFYHLQVPFVAFKYGVLSVPSKSDSKWVNVNLLSCAQSRGFFTFTNTRSSDQYMLSGYVHKSIKSFPGRVGVGDT